MSDDDSMFCEHFGTATDTVHRWPANFAANIHCNHIVYIYGTLHMGGQG